MATKLSFKVSKNENSASHDVAVTLPTFAEATEKQRENMWNEGISSVRIKVQGTLRRRLAKGVKPGAALNAEAQTAFDNVMNGTRAQTGGSVIDAAALFAGFDLSDEGAVKLARTQLDALTSSGATVINIPAELAGK